VISWDAVVRGTQSYGKDEVIVPLNAESPTLGYLDPPHDRRNKPGRG
jgi:hypothetical protein